MKMKMSRLSTALLAACGASLLPTLAFAADEEQDQAERVQITGSRIKRTDTEGQSPVLTLDRSDLEKTGLTSIGEVLQQLTTGGKALSAKFNSSGNFGYPPDAGGIGAGSAQVDLRHLESKRVLVLVDGKRWVNESSASGVGGSVDLNTIPMAIVDRIEVLEDGASAIYGSDAIAGVVNIITRKDFDGYEINTYYGDYSMSGGETTKAEITLGGSSDKFSAVMAMSFNNQESISSSEYGPASSPVALAPMQGSSSTPQGRIVFCDDRNPAIDCSAADGNAVSIALNDDVTIPLWDPFDPDGANGDSTYHHFGVNDRFNYAPYNLILTPSERKSVFASVRYQASEDVSWYMKSMFNTRDSTNQAAPEPIFLGPYTGNGNIADNIGVSADNPYNPFGIDLVAGENLFWLTRRPTEFGPRIFEQSVDTLYFSTGFEGSWGDMDWDLNFMSGLNRAEQKFHNSYNLRRIAIALGDPDICAANPGCVPLDLFGGQGRPITQEMYDWISMTTKDSSEQKLTAISGNLSGDLFELPAGMVGFAAGFESRTYKGSFSPDQVRIAGESNDSAAEPTSGSYDVDELYTEIVAPVFSGFDVNAAVRFSDYSNFGNESTGKIGFKWNITDEILVRYSFSKGFRAPFIGELFGSGQFGPTITDPCNNQVDNIPGTPGSLEERCRALGVPAGYQQAATQITTTTGGNPDLDPESSESTVFGVVYSPNWARDTGFGDVFDVSLTHYDHQIDDAIKAPDPQDLVDQCVAAGDLSSPYCANVGRNLGQITRIDSRIDNIGKIETSGWDLKANWRKSTSIGNLSAEWQLTKVSDYKEEDVFGNIASRDVGVELNDSAIPEIQSTLALGWSLNDVSVTWTMRYIDEVEEKCSNDFDGAPYSLTALGLCSNPSTTVAPDDDNDGEPDTASGVVDSESKNILDATTYHDLQVTWSNAFGIGSLTLNAGINNVLDKDPPVCFSCTLNGYDAGTYDLPGRMWFVQAIFRQ